MAAAEEPTDFASVSGLKGEMYPRDRSVRHVHPQLVGGEVGGTFGHGVQATERSKHGLVEPLAGCQIRYTQVYVVYQSATMELHSPSDPGDRVERASHAPRAPVSR